MAQEPSILMMLSDKETFKYTYAQAVSALLPHYDLVVVDAAVESSSSPEGYMSLGCESSAPSELAASLKLLS